MHLTRREHLHIGMSGRLDRVSSRFADLVGRVHPHAERRQIRTSGLQLGKRQESPFGGRTCQREQVEVRQAGHYLNLVGAQECGDRGQCLVSARRLYQQPHDLRQILGDPLSEPKSRNVPLAHDLGVLGSGDGRTTLSAYGCTLPIHAPTLAASREHDPWN